MHKTVMWINRRLLSTTSASILVFLTATQSINAQSAPVADPAFSGTIFISPNIITSADPSAFTNLTYIGQGMRTMFDRRVKDWITVNAYLFQVSFNDGLFIEIQVNPEFGSSQAALAEAQKYAVVIGRLPTILRSNVQTVWIHQGDESFGGGNNNLLIYTDRAESFEADGILEETFVHEAAHTSLDPDHEDAPDWLVAQRNDNAFISDYARDFPMEEDIAESFLPYWAMRTRPDRLDPVLVRRIQQTIPNRIAYFDRLFGSELSLEPSQPTSFQNNPHFYQLQTHFPSNGLCLDIVNDTNDNQLIMANCGNYSGQRWRLQPTAKIGFYRFKTQFTGTNRCLDIANADQLIMADCSDHSGQFWYLQPTQAPEFYRLQTQFMGVEKCLDHDTNTNQLTAGDCINSSSQFWKIF